MRARYEKGDRRESAGPATRTGRRPNRSMSQPEGIVPVTFPKRKAVMTPLASPNATPNDWANAGRPGKEIPVPSASTRAGRYVERNVLQESALWGFASLHAVNANAPGKTSGRSEQIPPRSRCALQVSAELAHGDDALFLRIPADDDRVL